MSKQIINSGIFTSRSDDWATPQSLFDKLDSEFYFDLDVAANSSNAKCKNYFNKKQNGLSKDWFAHSKGGAVFCNPPYGKNVGHWLKKAHEESKKGCVVVCILPFRSDTRYFHDQVFNKANEIRLIRGRVSYNDRGRSPFPTAIIIYSNHTNKKTVWKTADTDGNVLGELASDAIQKEFSGLNELHDNKAHSSFVAQIEKDLTNQVKYNKLSIEKLGASFGITDKTQVKELTELAIVKRARILAHSEGTIRERFEKIVGLYHSQVNLSHRTSQSILLQQYSTPAPIAYLAGVFCRLHLDEGFGFEPSAGNGLLTIAGKPETFIVNEIDPVRNANLQVQGFTQVLKRDATKQFHDLTKRFDAVLTNPPFGVMETKVMYETFAIKPLEHVMALRALDCMKDNGKAAIIIGGHTTWDNEGRIQKGKNRIFFNYLYSRYHVADIIMIDGHKLYSRQGTSFNVRLILVDGRKQSASGNAPLFNPQSDFVVKTFDELFNRVMDATEPDNYTQPSIAPTETQKRLIAIYKDSITTIENLKGAIVLFRDGDNYVSFSHDLLELTESFGVPIFTTLNIDGQIVYVQSVYHMMIDHYKKKLKEKNLHLVTADTLTNEKTKNMRLLELEAEALELELQLLKTNLEKGFGSIKRNLVIGTGNIDDINSETELYGGKYFLLEEFATSLDFSEIERKEKQLYNITNLKIADTKDVGTRNKILKTTIDNGGHNAKELSLLVDGYKRGQVDVQMVDEIPAIKRTAQKLGYDGMQVWENDDMVNPNLVYIWNTENLNYEDNGPLGAIIPGNINPNNYQLYLHFRDRYKDFFKILVVIKKATGEYETFGQDAERLVYMFSLRFTLFSILKGRKVYGITFNEKKLLEIKDKLYHAGYVIAIIDDNEFDKINQSKNNLSGTNYLYKNGEGNNEKMFKEWSRLKKGYPDSIILLEEATTFQTFDYDAYVVYNVRKKHDYLHNDPSVYAGGPTRSHGFPYFAHEGFIREDRPLIERLLLEAGYKPLFLENEKAHYKWPTRPELQEYELERGQAHSTKDKADYQRWIQNKDHSTKNVLLVKQGARLYTTWEEDAQVVREVIDNLNFYNEKSIRNVFGQIVKGVSLRVSQLIYYVDVFKKKGYTVLIAEDNGDGKGLGESFDLTDYIDEDGSVRHWRMFEHYKRLIRTKSE